MVFLSPTDAVGRATAEQFHLGARSSLVLFDVEAQYAGLDRHRKIDDFSGEAAVDVTAEDNLLKKKRKSTLIDERSSSWAYRSIFGLIGFEWSSNIF